MKEYFWRWLFWGSVIYCGLLAISLIVAYLLFSTAPNSPNTPVFAIGFGFAVGFVGLGAVTLLLFDRLSKKLDITPEEEGELFRKVIRETPFFSFSLLYFFALGLFIGIIMLMIPYIRNACA